MKAHFVPSMLATVPAIFVVTAALAANAPAPIRVGPNGATLFQQKCAACHQAHGEGLSGAFPKLAGDKFVIGDPAEVVRRVLDGRNAMPSFRNALTDDEIAAVLTHIRSNWGNKANAVTPAMVSAARKAK